MQNIITFLLIAIIIYCLIFGCRRIEGLENQNNCSSYNDKGKCMEAESCGWVVSNEYPNGKCLYSKSEMDCSVYKSAKECTENERCGWLVNNQNPNGVCLNSP